MHTFYEAVGYMIGAQTDQAVQEHLIEKYMLLPNQVWDSIIQQATKVSHIPLWDCVCKPWFQSILHCMHAAQPKQQL